MKIQDTRYNFQANSKSQISITKRFGFWNLFLVTCLFLVIWLLFLAAPRAADASTLNLSPSLGSFEIGETFDVQILVDTEGQIVNTVWALLEFPPDALQIVSPSTGTSIIGIWTRAPRFDNTQGTIELQGVIPGGINTRNGVVTTVTFRVNRLGTALVKFLDESAVLLHDGHGTPSLRETRNANYNLTLPPAEGPIVTSSSHPEQDKWYSDNSVSFGWQGPIGVEGYSYVLDQTPNTVPDDISEGTRNSVEYANTADGTHYFHIKMLHEGNWGGVTHFAVNVDTLPPAEFNIDISPSSRTSSLQPVINFSTTDRYSGISRYELKIVPLKGDDPQGGFFIEAASPYATSLELGDYDVIVRAYDNAGNVRESVQRLEIVTLLFNIVSGEGIQVQGKFIIPWWIVFLLLLLLLVILAFIAWRVYKKHKEADEKLATKQITPELESKLKELQDYKQKYGGMMVLLLALASLWFIQGGVAHAQTDEDAGATLQQVQEEARSEEVSLAPPSITTISRDITNEDIFYAGGRVNVSGAEVVLLLQNMTTGETISRVIEADEDGEWFYRHNSFLTAGRYLIWAQTRSGQQMSPPSAQLQITVNTTALQFGSTRVSYASLFLILASLLLLVNAGLAVFIWHHRKNAKIKHSRFMKEVGEAEESIRRGFAILRQDIKAELDTVKKAKVGKTLGGELEEREKELLRDLEAVEQKIGKEIWDVERSEHQD